MYSIQYIYIRIRSLLIQGCNIDINLVCTIVSKLVPNAGCLMLTPKVSKKMLVRVRLASVQWLRWMFLRVLGVTRLHSRGKLYYCLAPTAVINRKQGIKWASAVWTETSGLRQWQRPGYAWIPLPIFCWKIGQDLLAEGSLRRGAAQVLWVEVLDWPWRLSILIWFDLDTDRRDTQEICPKSFSSGCRVLRQTMEVRWRRWHCVTCQDWAPRD